MKFITSSIPAITASDHLNEALALYTTQPLLLMLSGGSALTILEHIDVSLLGPHVTITTLDERFSTDPTVNNFAQITATNFYRKAIEQGVKTISTEVSANETLSESGEHFNTAIHQWRENCRDGVIIATMGVGDDGHTAGIFTQQQDLDFETTDWIMSYKVPPEVDSYTMRITVTPTFLKTQVTQAICLITGEEKRDVLKTIQSPDCTITDMPACIMNNMSSVTVITNIN